MNTIDEEWYGQRRHHHRRYCMVKCKHTWLSLLLKHFLTRSPSMFVRDSRSIYSKYLASRVWLCHHHHHTAHHTLVYYILTGSLSSCRCSKTTQTNAINTHILTHSTGTEPLVCTIENLRPLAPFYINILYYYYILQQLINALSPLRCIW